MLVLRRRQGESVYIGKHMEVVVLELRGNRVKLGFRGPENIAIIRAENCNSVGGPYESLCHAECA